MATYPLTTDSSSLNPLARRDYLVWREPDMAEAEALAEPASGVVRHFGMEQRTETFARAFAERVGVSFACPMASREAAMRVALKALGLGAGDDVVVAAITPITTANSVLRVGANPVLADVDPATHLLTTETVDRVRTKQTRAVVVTHLCGRAANLLDLETYARDSNLALINDAGLGIEIQHGGRNIGQFGTLSIYGTDPARQGRPREGGVITTSNAVLAERLLQLRRARSLNGPAARTKRVRVAGCV